MATRSADSVLNLCHKATVLGNKISIHMLEYLGTVEKRSHQFDELAHEFMDTSRIMWSLEAGLVEFTRSNQKLPVEMISELEKKFRAAHSDFQVLDSMLGRYLDYEKKGTVGRFQKGWRSMFSHNDVDKMRENLEKTREALCMSALVFQWSLGDTKIDESVGIGYTGLAAALDRISGSKSAANLAKAKSVGTKSDVTHQVHPVETTPQLPSLSYVGNSRSSGADHSSLPGRESSIPGRESSLPVRERSLRGREVSMAGRESSLPGREDGHHSNLNRLLPEVQREPSISGYTIHTDSSHGVGRDRRLSIVDNSDKPTPMAHNSPDSRGRTESDTLIEEMDALEPFKVVRFKADPLSQPRWAPRNSLGADNAQLRDSLVAAVESRNHKMVEQLLDRGVSPNLGPHAHILNQAISHHDVESVRLLLLFGADVNAAESRGATPLYLAVEESFIEGANMLLKYGADPNLTAGHGAETPLSAAIVEDKFTLARLLLAYGGDVSYVMAEGDTLLMTAIKHKRPKKIIDLLLDYGSDANTKNSHGHTPMFEAIQTQRIEVVASLLDHRANPNLPGPKHMLWPAASMPRILELLLARGADARKAPGVMELATSENNIESVRVLLKAGVDPNAKKDGIYTPLCSSIRDDRADIFDLLLKHGADPNVPSAEYPAFKCVTHYRTQYLAPLVAAGADLNSPKGILETAVQCYNLEALIWLLDSGKVSPNDKVPKTGATPLTTAIRENRPDLVDLLLSRGADPNIRGENWPVCMAVKQPAILKRLLPALAEPRAFKGVMEMAVVANQLESVKLLIKAGVSVEDRNGGVFSPLTTAIREERKDIVRFLLEAGADVNSPGEHLPIVKALRRMHGADTEVVELLLRHGADPNKMYRGHNGYFQAIENGDSDVLSLLAKSFPPDLDACDDAGMTLLQVASSRGWDEGRQILLAAGTSANGGSAAATAGSATAPR
ncbi:hypothetical protein DL766_001034 [Monosporascus sp. MC13-8B]|nr:hypothetical protein DL763_000575 [Monosporascus cannonballus]RYP38325.1 hypothetical protein DL766_001034 [Monosporascus sp. MC13-8B]